MQKIPESGCVRKEIVDKDINKISSNGDRKSMQPIRIIIIGCVMRMRK